MEIKKDGSKKLNILNVTMEEIKGTPIIDWNFEDKQKCLFFVRCIRCYKRFTNNSNK